MTHYICLKDWKRFPAFGDLAAFVLDESFRDRHDLGFEYSYDKRTRKPGFLMLSWPKWKENPDLPMHVHSGSFFIVFSPFNIRHSKRITKRGRASGYPKICQATSTRYHPPALADHRIFYRGVYYFAKEAGGLIFERSTGRALTPEEYYGRHKKIIDYPFHLHLTKEDIARVPSNTF
jgi:hypothetical protein